MASRAEHATPTPTSLERRVDVEARKVIFVDSLFWVVIILIVVMNEELASA